MGPQRCPRRSKSFKLRNRSSAQVPRSLRRNSIDSEERSKELPSPESIRFVVLAPLPVKELSPTILAKVPKLKLDLDIPEEDSEEDVCKKDINCLDEKISLDKTYDKILLEPEISEREKITIDDSDSSASVVHFASPAPTSENKMAPTDSLKENRTILNIEENPNEPPKSSTPLLGEPIELDPEDLYALQNGRNSTEHDNLKIDESNSSLEIILQKNVLISSSIFPDDFLNYEERSPTKIANPEIDQTRNISTLPQTGQMAIACQNEEISKSSIKTVNLAADPEIGLKTANNFFSSTFRSPSKTTLNFHDLKITREKGRTDDFVCEIGAFEEIVVDQLNHNSDRSSMLGSLRAGSKPESPCRTICVMMEHSGLQQVEEDIKYSEDPGRGSKARTRMKGFTESVKRVIEMMNWVANKMIFLMKTGCGVAFRVFHSSSTGRTSKKELLKVVEHMQRENEKTAGKVLDKITCLTKEVVQTCATNQESLSVLTKEVESLKSTNQQLLGSNEILMKELKLLSAALDTLKCNSKALGPSIPSNSSIPPPPPPPPPIPGPQGPPPPPPPPPPMPSLISTTPKTSLISKKKSPRKCSTPLPEARPSITVEDLLKVTLKKAPQHQKKPAKPTSASKGPVVSLDMLKSVKLKSARRKSTDCTRSPRRVHPYSRNSQSLSTLSPISARERSPLHRILRQTGSPRRRLRRTMSPTISSHSDHELSEGTREIDARCNIFQSFIT